MSKYVKSLITDHVRQQLDGVGDALLVDVIGLSANVNHRLRTELRNKNINLMVIKNRLAARAAAGTPLAAMFEEMGGSAAVCWGGEDIVSLAKEVVRLARDDHFAPFAARGGVIDGQRITDVQVVEVSKWPSRAEQLSLLAGQILSVGALLASQLTSIGGALASQIAERAKGADDEAAPEGEAVPAEPEKAESETKAESATQPSGEQPPAPSA